MSRHRIVRTMDYSEEYDGFDDVYGHSVEDEYCISPSDAAQFMFDRTRQPQMSAFFNEENNIAEEDESNIESSKQDHSHHDSDIYQRPGLSDVDEVRLRSCIEEIHNVIGDSVPEHILIDSILKNDFNFSKALDAVLSSAASASEKPAADAPKPQRERRTRDRDDESDGCESVGSSPHLSFFNPMSNTEIQNLRESVEKLGIRDTISLSTKEPYSTQDIQQGENLGNLFKIQIKENRASHPVASCDEIACGSTCSSCTVVLKNYPLTIQPLCSNCRNCGQFGVHDANLCVQRSSVTSTSSESSSKSIETENVPVASGNGSSIKLNIPRLKMKVRNDSEKENFTEEDDYVSSLQSLKLQNQSKVEKYSLASDEKNFSSLTQLAKKQSSRVLEPKPSDKSTDLSSLAKLANKHFSGVLKSQPSEESSNLSSIAQLADGHSSEALEQTSEGNNFSSLAQLANKCSLQEVESQSLHEGSHFSYLAQLVSSHNKVIELRESEEDDHFSSLAKLSNRCSKLTEKELEEASLAELVSRPQQVQREECISSLADLASQHLKIHGKVNVDDSRRIKETDRLLKVKPKPCSSQEFVDMTTCVILSPGNKCSTVSGKLSSIVQRFDNNLPTVSQTLRADSKRKGFKSFLASEIVGELVSDLDTSSNITEVGSNPVVSTLSEDENGMDWEIDLTRALMTPGSETLLSSENSKPKIINCKFQDMEQEVPVEIFPHETPEVTLNFDSSLEILNQKFPNCKTTSTPFGRVLCRKWKKLPTYTVPRKQSLGKIVCFTFSTNSPDDEILRHLKRM